MGLRRYLKNGFKPVLRELIDEQRSNIERASGQKTIYLGNDLLLTRTRYGHRMFLVASDVSLTPHIALDGYWEEWITNIFRGIVKPGMHVVDVGANVGYYTLLAAELVGPSGHVWSFEANKALAKIVYRNLQINGFPERSTVVDKAVFSEAKTLSFSIYKDHKGSSGIWETQEDARLFHDEVEVVEVEAVTIDQQFAGQRVDVIKIDAEGAEGDVLKGAQQVIEKNPGIQLLIEYNPHFVSNGFGSLEGFHSMIAGFGFEIHVACHDSTLKKMTFQEMAAANIKHCDIVLKRPR